MANCKKATRGAMGHLMRHYERSKDENGEYIKFGNQQIDPSRTYLNYNLAPDHDQLEFTQTRLKEVYVLNRKDVNVMCSWVVTAPKELPEEYHKEFFERTYRFLQQRYDAEGKNTISAYVHMDEASPHMHYAFIPVVYDKKKNREKVSAKEVINRHDLQTFHKDFQAEMDRFVKEHNYQFDCNVLNGATVNGNKTIEEYKAEILAELNEQENDRLSSLTARSNDKEMQLEVTEDKIKKLSQRSERLTNDVTALEIYKSTLDTKINAIEGEYDAINGDDKVLMQKFVEHPQIKPVYDRFCKTERDRIIHDRQELKKSVKATLARYQSDENDQKRENQQKQHEHRANEL